jgi:GDP-D-mannose dehydratase
LKKVLITGALGQDGLILSKLYLKKKFKVYGFIKKGKGQESKIKKIIYKINDLKSKSNIMFHLKTIKPNIILHLASTNNSHSKRKNKETYKLNYLNNMRCTKNLLDSIIENNLKTNLIFAGSSLMFARSFKKKVSEKNKFKSNEYYGQYKIDSHKLILSMKKKYNINATTAILFNHDSEFRNKNFLIPKLVESFKNRNKNFIENIYKLNISGDFSHADDICKGIYNLSISKKNIDKLIISSGKRFYINKIINYLEKYYNFKIKKKIFKNNDNFNFLGCNKFAQKIINYKVKKNSIQACKDIIKSI